MTSRVAWLQKLLDPRRNIDQECGHPCDIDVEDYRRAFKRGDIATRVVTIFPEESWKESPIIVEDDKGDETAFEKAWDDLQKKHNIYSTLTRADVLSGIGRFGVILLGLDDGLTMDQPIVGINEDGTTVEGATPTERKLLYLRPFDESLILVVMLQQDPLNPRYGLPLFYDLKFTDTILGQDASTKRLRVHWSRVIHVADNRMSSDVFGLPRLERVFNRYLDLMKVAGGSGEMFWKGGFPGLSLEAITDAEGQAAEIDPVATKAQIEDYMNGLQRYIATVGLTVKSLTPQVADPRPHVDIQVRLIAMSLGIPWRIFMGSEAAQLASEQDSGAWNARIKRRREDYLGPLLIRVFIDRLIACGVLPTPLKDGTYVVEWPDLNTPSDKDKAAVTAQRTQALTQYVSTGADALMPPFHFFTLVMGMTDDEANAVIDAAGTQMVSQLKPPPPPPVIVAPGGPMPKRNGLPAPTPVPALRGQ